MAQNVRITHLKPRALSLEELPRAVPDPRGSPRLQTRCSEEDCRRVLRWDPVYTPVESDLWSFHSIGQEGHLSVPGASRLTSSNFNLWPPGFPPPSPCLEKFLFLLAGWGVCGGGCTAAERTAGQESFPPAICHRLFDSVQVT